MLYAVVMAGGSGTRFWPQSRRLLPKQLLRFRGEQTLLQETVGRCAPTISRDRILIVTGKDLVAETRRQLPDLDAAHVIAEPCQRNTAPCIGLAAVQLLSTDPQACMAVMPADHLIDQGERFRQALEQAAAFLDKHPNALMLFGIRPNYPSTGFGYIELGQTSDTPGVQRVGKFHEKPDLPLAQRYLAGGKHLWNSGIFVWRADTILRALAKYEPSIAAGLETLRPHLTTPGWQARLVDEFPKLKSISIDHAVLERADEVYVIEAPFDWDDVGSWEALPRLTSPDADQNTIDGTVVTVASQRCIIRGDPQHLIAAVGVDDLIIVHTPNATLVARRGDEAQLKQLIAKIETQGLQQFL